MALPVAPSTPEREFALAAVRQASFLARQIQAELVTPALTKQDRSPVTVGDFAAQALVSQRLAEAFPQDVLIGEESAADLRSESSGATVQQVVRFVQPLLPSATAANVCDWIDRGKGQPGPRFWTLDPIDGTKGFLRRDQYAVALALLVEGRPEIGALGCPNLRLPDLFSQAGFSQTEPGILFWAARGAGAWASPLAGDGPWVRLNVSTIADPVSARLLGSYESSHTNDGQLDEFLRQFGTQAEAVRMDSQAKYGVLAAGQGELLLRLLSANQPDYREKIWDHAAGMLIVTEAGGRVTDLTGEPLDFTQGRSLSRNRGLLVSNGPLHEPALAILRSIRAA